MDSPSLDLISTASEERDQVQHAVASSDDLGQHAADLVVGAVLGLVFGAHLEQLQIHWSVFRS